MGYVSAGLGTGQAGRPAGRSWPASSRGRPSSALSGRDTSRPSSARSGGGEAGAQASSRRCCCSWCSPWPPAGCAAAPPPSCCWSRLLIVVVTVAVSGSARMARAANWAPFAPHGWAAVGHAAALLMLSFVGWEAVAPLTTRFRDPRRQLTRVIAIALAVTTAIYLGLAVTVVGVLGPDAGSSIPLAGLLAGRHRQRWPGGRRGRGGHLDAGRHQLLHHRRDRHGGDAAPARQPRGAVPGAHSGNGPGLGGGCW